MRSLHILPLLLCLFECHLAGDGYSAPEQLQRTSCPSLPVLLLIVTNPATPHKSSCHSGWYTTGDHEGSSKCLTHSDGDKTVANTILSLIHSSSNNLCSAEACHCFVVFIQTFLSAQAGTFSNVPSSEYYVIVQFSMYTRQLVVLNK